MKYFKNLLILSAILFGMSMEVGATKYCETNHNFTLNISGQNKTFTCSLTLNYEEGKYVVILANMQMGGRAFYFDTNNMSGWTFTNENRTAEKRFDTKPTNVSFCGWNKNDSWGYAENQIQPSSPANYNLPNDAEWENACGPADTQNPVISSVAAQSTTQTSITVRVTATDNQANDTGVASITVTRSDNSQSQTQNISPAVIGEVYRDFVFSDLSAGTTYTFDVTVTDAAGRTASTSQSLATQAAVVDNTAPSITSAAAENIKATTADIRVQATDNIGVTRVVIKNGETTIKDENISSTASLNQVFTLTGLTKNTTYNNIKVIVYDAHPNASSTYNVASFTTKNTNTIYFVKSGASASWGATKIHYIGGWEETAWPGVDMTNTGMTNCDNTQIWRAEIPDNTTTVVFDNGYSGGDNQSSNQTPLANQYFNYERNTWYSPENLYILGEGDKFGDWTRSDDFKFSTWNGSTPTSVTKTLRLTGSTTYEFKIQYYDGVNAYWRSNNGTMTSNNCTKWLMNEANNCRITTGSTGNYTFTYDFTANKLSVTYPVPDVGCEGTSNYCTSGGNNFVHYTIKYIGGNILFTVNSTTASPLQTCKLSYAKNTSGQDAVNNVGMTVTDGVATYTLPATGVYASGTMYFYFTYKTAAMGSEGSSASGFSSGAFQYNIGGCVLDDGIPYMLSASKAGATTSSVTLNVSAIVNGSTSAVTQYKVSTDGGSTYSEPITATAGQITVSGLTANTEYTFVVKAYYDSNESENSKSVTARTKPASQCTGTRGDVDYTIAYDSDTRKMTITAESNTSNAITALHTHWLTYDDLSGGYIHYHNAGDAPEWATISDGIATAEYTIDAEDVGRIMLLRLGYNLGSGEVWTAGDPNGDTYNANNIFYIVGECPAFSQEEPQMTSAAATDVRQEEAVVHFTSRDNTTTAANMIYHVNVQSTSGYETEWDLLLTGQASGDYTLKGLVPGTGYTVTVYCEDEDGKLSTADVNSSDHKQKTFTFTTHNGDGCSWTSGESTVAVIGGPAWVALPEGMTYILKVSKHDNTHIAIEIDIYYDPATVSLGHCLLERYAGGILEAYLTTDRTYVTEFENTSGHRHIKAVAGADLKDPGFEAFWGADGWTSDNNFAVKIEWGYVGSSGGGPSAAGYYIINPKRIVDGTDCKGEFVITQQGRTPSMTLPAGYDGTFDEQILYYRQFTPGQWEPICFPFAVSSVEVYDPDENEMFTLSPDNYYLLREQEANVSGADFKESWFNTSDPKPLKKKAYNIFFPKNNGWGAFYTKKYVLFRGTNGSQTVDTEFSKGTAPSGDDQYTLYGNNTLSTTSLTAYFETSDGKYYEKETNRTLQPFECYVLANASTLARMPRIGPWRGENATTGIEDTWAETQMLQEAAVYNTFGQLLFTAQNTIYYDLMERCMTLPAGCYIIMSELGNKKIVIP